jgi:hypothetical protein
MLNTDKLEAIANGTATLRGRQITPEESAKVLSVIASSRNQQPSRARRSVAGVGTTLKSIIARELPGSMACNTCREQIARLNKMTPEEVLADIDNIVSDIFSRSETEAPKLWQRMAVKLDKAAHDALPTVHRATMKMLHGQPINTTETEYRIKMWVQEAAETVASNRPQKKNQPEHELRDFHELST